jgi:alkanesulfonate monooxygenase SsuD/methylene tetrahydromethanopterin reductase-like flavin-dependent oxidoreductase (luciferase family)
VLELLDDRSVLPRPLQPRIPLTIGGHGRTALGLAARHADRWSSYGGDDLDPEEAARLGRERNERLTQLCEQQGRDPGTVRRSILLGYPFVRETPWRSQESFGDVVERWSRAGFDELIVYYPPETAMPEGSVGSGVFESVMRGRSGVRDG